MLAINGFKSLSRQLMGGASVVARGEAVTHCCCGEDRRHGGEQY